MGEDSRALQIIHVRKEDHSFLLDEKALESILLREPVRDLNVMVLSVAGAFRKGKSFLLDFMLRFLYKQDTENWILNELDGKDDKPLTGFSWRGGSDPDTNGIQMWTEVFIVQQPSVAVVLMDTQGAFDSQSTVKDCATIFALSTMTSSVQVYNLTNNIQEDDLQHLQLFTEYGRLATEETSFKPFQTLLFLVRDWSFPYEYPYGLDGGKEFLERRLQVKAHQHEELQLVRRHIHACFNGIFCFLMPHPGLKVSTNPTFDGKLKDIDDEFKTHLESLVRLLLSPENLTEKEIGGSKISCRNLLEYFKAYIKVFQGEDLPHPRSILEATAEANNRSASALAKEYYHNAMEELCGGDKAYLQPRKVRIRHLAYREAAIEKFRAIKKMGGSVMSQRYEDQLEADIEDMLESYLKFNRSKNFFSIVRTPTAMLLLIVTLHIVSGFLGLLGLGFLSTIFNFFIGISILTLMTWSYIKYTGQSPVLGEIIDGICEVLLSGITSVIIDRYLNAQPATIIAGRSREQPSYGYGPTVSRRAGIEGKHQQGLDGPNGLHPYYNLCASANADQKSSFIVLLGRVFLVPSAYFGFEPVGPTASCTPSPPPNARCRLELPGDREPVPPKGGRLDCQSRHRGLGARESPRRRGKMYQRPWIQSIGPWIQGPGDRGK
ncbi:LOW QUALITY PROTEIN: atlastin-3-like [Heterodontus francisci]|uniref:LOW QUALITY PROTEIN: atlastin-3-like n=1 Tax=Heterodontus francisci TaxID=7792 RepID=UPI00355B6517